MCIRKHTYTYIHLHTHTYIYIHIRTHIQAIYCLNRALRLKSTPETLWSKALLLSETGQSKKAVEALNQLLGKLPEDDVEKRTDSCMLLARLYSNCEYVCAYVCMYACFIL